MIDRVQVRSPDPHNSHLIGRIGSIVGMKNRHISVLLDNTDTAHLFLPRELTLDIKDEAENPQPETCWCGAPSIDWGVCQEHWEDIEENDLPDTT